MSVSYNVVGIKPADDKFKSMQKIWELCRAQKVSVPDEVDSFFNGETPDTSGVRVKLGKAQGVIESRTEYYSGFEVDLRKLPTDVKIIRFEMSF